MHSPVGPWDARASRSNCTVTPAARLSAGDLRQARAGWLPHSLATWARACSALARQSFWQTIRVQAVLIVAAVALFFMLTNSNPLIPFWLPLRMPVERWADRPHPEKYGNLEDRDYVSPRRLCAELVPAFVRCPFSSFLMPKRLGGGRGYPCFCGITPVPRVRAVATLLAGRLPSSRSGSASRPHSSSDSAFEHPATACRLWHLWQVGDRQEAAPFDRGARPDADSVVIPRVDGRRDHPDM